MKYPNHESITKGVVNITPKIMYTLPPKYSHHYFPLNICTSAGLVYRTIKNIKNT